MEDGFEELTDDSSFESMDSEAEDIEEVACSGLSISREEADRWFFPDSSWFSVLVLGSWVSFHLLSYVGSNF